MIRRCFNDSAFLWQRACRGWPPRRPASVSSGGGECIERPAAILVDTQPRFSGMNFSVCACTCACVCVVHPCHSRSPPFYSLLCRSSSPLMHTRARSSFPSLLSGVGSSYSIAALTSTSAFVLPQPRRNRTSDDATLSVCSHKRFSPVSDALHPSNLFIRDMRYELISAESGVYVCKKVEFAYVHVRGCFRVNF